MEKAVSPTSTVACIDPLELAELIHADQAMTILDVRSCKAFAAGHLSRARNTRGSAAVAWAELTPRDRMLIVVCEDGLTSAGIARQIARRGAQRVACLGGGIHGWVAAGFALLRAEDVKPVRMPEVLPLKTPRKLTVSVRLRTRACIAAVMGVAVVALLAASLLV
ncbi:MAG: rhodanese-like domain-containing protein [Planctomycetes bacterium]|nr:rhodanese-like domain-containing protein [Planctomycetota bacterium]